MLEVQNGTDILYPHAKFGGDQMKFHKTLVAMCRWLDVDVHLL